MSVFLTVLAAVVAAGGMVFGILRVSMWMSDKKAEFGTVSWKDSGHGNSHGYGNGFDNDGFGGDGGGGGD